MSRRVQKKLTPKMLGLTSDTKLSDTFANSRTHFKTVSDNILGFFVVGGFRSPSRIAPIYRADVWIGSSKKRHIVSSYEVGPYYNEFSPSGEPDATGDALAYSISTLLGAMQRHGEHRKAIIMKNPKKSKR